MVTLESLRSAIEQLPRWSPDVTTRITWVNWRNGFQVKVAWYGNASFICYLDFGKDSSAREGLLKRVFDKYSTAGEKPSVIEGHGWSRLDYSLKSKDFISVNELAKIAEEMGAHFTVLYVQECVSSRPLFDLMDIPLVPGEMGKEWVSGSFIPYSCPSGQCL